MMHVLFLDMRGVGTIEEVLREQTDAARVAVILPRREALILSDGMIEMVVDLKETT